MRSIRTISVAPAVNGWLANTRCPHILHVFDRTCNLVNEHREVLSIVTSKIGNGPFNLVVDDWFLFSRLNREDMVSISNDHLTVGDMLLGTMDAICWSPSPDWERLYNHQDKIANRLSAFPVVNFPRINPSKANLASVLARADISSLKTLIPHLAGLGEGLTPAGDDFIMGALYAVWIMHPLRKAEFLAREVSNAAAPLTTSLSAAWLRAAGRGEAGEKWHIFLEALTDPDPIQIRSAAENIMSTGVTSGVEALAGFIATFHSYSEIKKSHVRP